MTYAPTIAECREKTGGANYQICTQYGYTWGMTESEMREHDKTANCATGTQIYRVEHSCYAVKSDDNGITYNDGSVLTF